LLLWWTDGGGAIKMGNSSRLCFVCPFREEEKPSNESLQSFLIALHSIANAIVVVDYCVSLFIIGYGHGYGVTR
jgi:hypothetical protein